MLSQEVLHPMLTERSNQSIDEGGVCELVQPDTPQAKSGPEHAKVEVPSRIAGSTRTVSMAASICQT